MTSSISSYVIAWMRALLLYHAQQVLCSDSLSSSDTADCPHTCFCNPLSRIVYCSRRGLDSVPTTLPRLTLQLNVNGNHFSSPVLRRANFSSPHASNIEHLYLSDCGIQRLEVNTFADLTQLRWLDLSDNRLRDIPHRAFYGLTLQHLFLNGNRDIRLLRGSFDGLVTSGLYLHDCTLQALHPATLTPLNGTLVNLWLNGNRLTGVDRSLAPIFSQLSHLRLGANPLHCGCATLWLKQLYDRHGGATFRGAEPPTCWTPARLRARHFDQLTSDELHCSTPSFGNIDATLDWRGTGRLRCTATGEPTPTIYWIRPSGRTRRFEVETSGWKVGDVRVSEGRNEGVLMISDAEARAGLYICVAKNDVGNVTLTMNMSWSGTSLPPTPRVQTHSVDQQQPPTLSIINLQPAPDVKDRYESARQDVDDDNVRMFSVSEMVAAVVGTHLCTVLLFLVVLLQVQVIRSRRRQRNEAADNLRVCDSLLNKSALKPARSTNTVHTHHWPMRCAVNYDVT